MYALLNCASSLAPLCYCTTILSVDGVATLLGTPQTREKVTERFSLEVEEPLL